MTRDSTTSTFYRVRDARANLTNIIALLDQAQTPERVLAALADAHDALGTALAAIEARRLDLLVAERYRGQP